MNRFLSARASAWYVPFRLIIPSFPAVPIVEIVDHYLEIGLLKKKEEEEIGNQQHGDDIGYT